MDFVLLKFPVFFFYKNSKTRKPNLCIYGDILSVTTYTSMANTLGYIDTGRCCHRNITVQNEHSKKKCRINPYVVHICLDFLYKTKFVNQGKISYCCVYFIYLIQVPLWILQQYFKELLIIHWRNITKLTVKFVEFINQIEFLRVFTDFHVYKVKYFTMLGYNSFIHISI